MKPPVKNSNLSPPTLMSLPKKNYIYFTAPLAALIIFVLAFYIPFNRSYEAKQKAIKAAVEKVRLEKLQKEADARKIAIGQAVAAAEKRKKDAADKKVKEEADKKTREAAWDKRDKARRDQFKLEDQLKRIQKEVNDEKAAIAKLDEQEGKLKEDKGFLSKYVKQAESNVKSLAEIIDKVAAVDAAKAEADAKAAKAAKS